MLRQRIRVHGTGAVDVPGNRVLVVPQYRTPEMDYFSERALPFLRGLIDKYADAGVRLNGLYADEMHIQHPCQESSYHKLLGQLQDQGHTDLIKNYPFLLECAFLYRGLEKYSRVYAAVSAGGTMARMSRPNPLPCACR
jgi:hypothetical protein